MVLVLINTVMRIKILWTLGLVPANLTQECETLGSVSTRVGDQRGILSAVSSIVVIFFGLSKRVFNNIFFLVSSQGRKWEVDNFGKPCAESNCATAG